MNSQKPFLKDVLPLFFQEIKQTLLDRGYIELVEQMDSLRVFQLCECEDANCGSFYTAHHSNQEEEFDVSGIIIREASIVVEVIAGKISFIEILPSQYGASIRFKLLEELK